MPDKKGGTAVDSTNTLLRKAEGRIFIEDERYHRLKDRIITGITNNKMWLYSVDSVVDNKTGKVFIQIVRWTARNDKSNPSIKYWQHWRHYNVRDSEQWVSASQGVYSFLESLSEPARDFVRLDIPSVDFTTSEEEFAELGKKLTQKDETERFHRSEALRSKQRLREMRKHASEYRRILKAFAGIVENPESKEEDIHEFIGRTKPFWMFGLEYSALESHVPFPPKKKKFEFDLMLRRYDQFLDLVELKGPNARLFAKMTRNRSRLSSKLSEALGQVLAYLCECDGNPSVGMFKPKAFIVIGNKESDDPRQRRLLMSHLSRVDIWTYEELLAHGHKLLEHIVSIEKKTKHT